MDSKGILAMLMLLLVPMSGCLGFGDDGGDEPANDDEHDHSDHDHGDDCPDADATVQATDSDGGDENGTSFAKLPVTLAMQANETGNETGSEAVATTAHDCPGIGDDDTPDVPNELPIANLTLSKADGTVMGPSDFIFPGETITFSANGTSDPDGSVDLVGLTVKDTNSTRTVQLFLNGAFVTETMTFPKAGPVNITMRVLDSRGEGVVLHESAAVNDQRSGSIEAQLYDPEGDDCRPSVDVDDLGLVGNQFTEDVTFTVSKGAKWLSAKSDDARYIVLCDGDGNRLAHGSGEISTDEQEWPAGSAYKLVIYTELNEGASYAVTVHYEPKAAE